MSWSELQKAWDARLSPAERETWPRSTAARRSAVRPTGGERAAVDHALEHVFARSSVATERELLTEALEARHRLASPWPRSATELDRRPLIRGVEDGRAVASIASVLAEEREIVAIRQAGQGPLAGRLATRTGRLSATG